MSTNFPNGVSSFGVPVLGSGPIFTTGNVFFVDSGASNAADTTANGEKIMPFATLDYAIGQCTANNGDHIVLMPGHSETLASAGAVTVDVAGLTIVGIGHGSARPTFNFTDTASTFLISAANTRIDNILWTGGVDAIVTMTTISAADCYITNLETRDVTGQMNEAITTTAAANRLHINGWYHRGAAGDGGDHAFLGVGGTDVEIENFSLVGNFDEGAIEWETTAATQAQIHDGYIWNQGSEDLAIVMLTASTGRIGPNVAAMLTDDAQNITEAFVGDAMQFFQPIRIINTAGESSMETNITATTDAIV
jgi:hypothetical protein